MFVHHDPRQKQRPLTRRQPNPLRFLCIVFRAFLFDLCVHPAVLPAFISILPAFIPTFRLPSVTPPPAIPHGAAKLPLSIALVCKNSAATIGLTLQRLAPLATEIIALDSGSTDGTLDLLRAHGATIHQVQWQGFIKTKQAALDACTQPWILCVDSDESPEPVLAQSLRQAITADDQGLDGYTLNRKVWYNGQFLEHAWQPEHRLRLVRRGCARWTGLDPHDQLVLTSPNASTSSRTGHPTSHLTGHLTGHLTSHLTGHLTGDLRHDSIVTFTEFLAKQCAHGRTMAASMHAQGRTSSYFKLVTSPPAAFAKQIILKRAFLDGYRGWLAAAATATAALAKHAALIEMQNAQTEKPSQL